jgi:hypothetical protein
VGIVSHPGIWFCSVLIKSPIYDFNAWPLKNDKEKATNLLTMSTLLFRNQLAKKFSHSFLVILFLTVFFLGYAQASPTYPVRWINPLRVYVNGTILTKGNYPATWIAGAISSNVLEANVNGSIEFASTAGAHYVLGLAYDNVHDWDRFGYAIIVDQTNDFQFFLQRRANQY